MVPKTRLLSSRLIPAAPARSNAWTVKWTFTAFPKPVSASPMTGMPTLRAMRPVTATMSVMDMIE
jgi:hypothetical protein